MRYTGDPNLVAGRVIEFDTLANSIVEGTFNGKCSANYGWLS